MQRIPLKVAKSLENRKEQQAFRAMLPPSYLVDFASNDYLGYNSSELIYEMAAAKLEKISSGRNGAGGSRLLTGNHLLYAEAESVLARFHQGEAAVIFNSGYDANLGLLSSVVKRGDLILFDELSHASIRDGILLSPAKSLKFKHNDPEDLQRLLETFAEQADTVYVVTESVFSMDGDCAPLRTLAAICEEFSGFLIVDEAHATGIYGPGGEGLVQEKELQNRIFARVITFGKALGSHGAAVVGGQILKEYLINFARSLIYTTALPPHTVATVLAAYQRLQREPETIRALRENILFFNAAIKEQKLQGNFIQSTSAIHSCIIPGNERVKKISLKLAERGFDVRPILSPTVPEGKERLRFCLHSFNSDTQMTEVLNLLRATLDQN